MRIGISATQLCLHQRPGLGSPSTRGSNVNVHNYPTSKDVFFYDSEVMLILCFYAFDLLVD